MERKLGKRSFSLVCFPSFLSFAELQVEMVPESVVEGGEVTLTCKSTCSLTNAPIFTWYKNGRDLHSFYWSDRLHLQSVSQEDAGSYSCAVQGESYRSPAVTLNVHCKCTFIHPPSGKKIRGFPSLISLFMIRIEFGYEYNSNFLKSDKEFLNNQTHSSRR